METDTNDQLYQISESATALAFELNEAQAERIARRAHHGQVEESTGAAYIHHVERVVEMVTGPATKATAWLHDVLEDSSYTFRDLLRWGIHPRIVEAVELLTWKEPDDYASYVGRIKASGNKLALDVKLADLKDHLRPNCPERLRPRYERALAVLEQ